MWRLTLRLTLCIAWMTVASLQVRAQNDTLVTKGRTLRELTVRGDKSKQVTSTSPFQIVTKQDLLQQGITDLSDALRRFSGVNVKDYGGAGGIKTVSVRSLGSQHTAVSYDGVAVSDLQSGQVDLSRFTLDNIRSLSLAIGDNDDIFLPARTVASAATLRLQTLLPDLVDKNSHLKAEIKTGSFGMFNPYMRYDQKISEKVSTSVSGDYLRADNQYPFQLVNVENVTKEYRNNNQIETWRTEGNVYVRPSTNATLNGKVYYYQSWRELPGPVILYNAISHEKEMDRNFFAQANYKSKLGGGFSLLLNGKFNWAYSHYHDEGGQYPGGELNNKYYQREYYGSAAVMYEPTEHLAFAYAGDYAYNTLNANANLKSKPLRHTVLQTLSARYHLDRLALTAILLRSDYWNKTKLGNPSKDAHRLSPSLSLSWKALEEAELYLRASYKDVFRVATFTENYFDRMGSRDLNPEIARQYNVGVTYQVDTEGLLNHLQLSTDGYFNYVKDKIVAKPYNMFYWTMLNLGKVHIWGADVNLDADFRLNEHHHLLFGGAYTYQYAVDKTMKESISYKNQIPYTPRHTGSASLAWENPWLNTSIHATGVSDRYTTEVNTEKNMLNGYIEYGVSLYRSFSLGDVQMAMRGEVINLGNKQYSIVKSYPMPGRSYKLTLSIEL